MSAATKPKTSGIVVPQQAKWHGRLAARLIWLVAQTLAATLRWRLRDESGLFTPGAKEPVIFCIWHNRLALSLILYRRYIQPCHAERRMAAMVSASKDGGMLARVLELFGVQPVRGSSSRRGPQALLELTSWSERGCDLAITPDGPRGPCYAVQDGIMALAQLTGLPIVPVSYELGWKLRLQSWDKFQVPLPLSRCVVRFGEPLRVPREATDAERDALRAKLESRMREITRD
ncbi:MAG: lysophospholipid acyltransferase family protein [Verrucomicrobia bacterium]|nr:lysophospholipid acyltransferase family protein [Verrucomicrobiota bacterium]